MKYFKQPLSAFIKTAKGFVTTDETGIYVTAKELAKTLQDARANAYGSSKDHDITYIDYNPMNPKSEISNSAEEKVNQSSN